MKKGKSLQEMALELGRQVKAKRDFVSPSGELSMGEMIDEKDAADRSRWHRLRVNGYGEFNINNLGHEQIAGRLFFGAGVAVDSVS